MPAPVSFAHLSHRWTEGDARWVLAALDASGLRPCEFARRSGVHVKRLWSWRRRLGQPRSGVRSPTPPAEAARLVELVPRSGLLGACRCPLRRSGDPDRLADPGTRRTGQRPGARAVAVVVPSLPPAVKVYLAIAPVDMRKGVDALARVVRHVIRQEPQLCGALQYVA